MSLAEQQGKKHLGIWLSQEWADLHDQGIAPGGAAWIRPCSRGLAGPAVPLHWGNEAFSAAVSSSDDTMCLQLRSRLSIRCPQQPQ